MSRTRRMEKKMKPSRKTSKAVSFGYIHWQGEFSADSYWFHEVVWAKGHQECKNPAKFIRAHVCGTVPMMTASKAIL